MKSLAFAFLLFTSFCFLGVSGQVQEHVLDLSLPPKQRYAKYVPLYKDKVKKVLDYVTSKVPSAAFDLLTVVLADMDAMIGQPYADEIRGLAECGGFSLGDVVLLNVFYELTAGCTSLVALNTHNRSAVHGRNLDFNIPHLGPITVQVKVERNGTYLYHATTFAGYVGVLTGMKPATARAGGWTFSLDQRTEEGPVGVWLNALEALVRGGRVASLFARELMDRTGTAAEIDFPTAGRLLATTHLTAPSYLILSNTSGGMVITRDREAAADVWYLNPASNPPAIVETNYDHWKPPPKDDDRRTPAYARLRTLGSTNYGPESVFAEVMSQPPNLNHHTVYTTIMELATQTYRTVQRQFTR
eukprot:TRINITY_DN2382_c0_g1_i1.p1 TRINITY_DN2382_c0_g1~~TRINITY_DN2382_c0_g1_i1.p1  ORF type:complete len:358 (-),score=75.12 TRINITY_DN2382_c0_g1_i1:427-1500(-)